MAKRVRRTFRVAIVGIGCENCTFSTLPTKLEHFRPLLDEDKLKECYKFLTDAQPGARLDLAETQFLDRNFCDVDFLYCCRYRAIPGGPIERQAFETMLRCIGETLDRHLSVAPLDGVYLDLHGAMFATGYQDAEGEVLALVRSRVGSETLLSASFDLHGNISSRIARTLDMATAYRTAPHIDIPETQLKALHMLLCCLRRREDDAEPALSGGASSRRPHLAYCPVPLGVSGEMSNTCDEPSASLYGSVLQQSDRAPGVLDASILIGYVWGDEPRMGCSVLVSGFDASAADAEALRIASCIWDRRGDFKFGVQAAGVDEVLDLAVAAAAVRTNGSKPVVVSDSGDNPTAGGVGDTPSLVEALVRKGIGDVVVQGPVDRAAVEACLAAGVGAEAELEIGGKLDYENAKPYRIKGIVGFVNPDATLSYEVDENAGTDNGTPMPKKSIMPEAAVLRVPTPTGNVLVTLTAERKPFHYEKDFQVLEIEPSVHRILVVKIGYLVPDLERMASVNLMALSPGAVFADVASMPYKHIRRPMFPLDRDMEWVPALAQ